MWGPAVRGGRGRAIARTSIHEAARWPGLDDANGGAGSVYAPESGNRDRMPGLVGGDEVGGRDRRPGLRMVPDQMPILRAGTLRREPCDRRRWPCAILT